MEKGSEAPHLSWTRTYALMWVSVVRLIVPLDVDLHSHAAVGGIETCAMIARSLVLSEI